MENKINLLLSKPTQFLSWWRHPEGEPFKKAYLQEWRNHIVFKLARERDDVEIHRLQGELRAIDTLLTLEQEVSEYIKGVNNGTMKRIGEQNAKPVQK